MESMRDTNRLAREEDAKAMADLKAKVEELTADLKRTSDDKIALETSKEMLESQVAAKEKQLLQLAEGAGDIATYYSQERAIEMMEEHQAGHDTAWNAEESRKQLALDFPGGPPSMSLMDLYLKIVATEEPEQ